MTTATKKKPAKKAGKRAASGKPKSVQKLQTLNAPQVLRLDEITVDQEIQQRAGGVSKTVVEEYRDALLDGNTFPPIDVFEDENHLVLLAEGFQRYEANLLAGNTEVECIVHQGGRDDAIWFACSANKTHGLRRTHEDKRRAVRSALLLPHARALSDRAIADHVGVSPSMVGRVRLEMVEAGEIAAQEVRVAADGRKINMAAERGGKVKAGQAAGVSKKVAKGDVSVLDGDAPADDDVVDDAEALGGTTETDVDLGEQPAKPAKPAKVNADVKDGLLLDAEGQPVPDELRTVFAPWDMMHGLKRQLDKLADVWRALCKSDAGVFLSPVNADVLDTVAEELEAGIPYTVAVGSKLGWEPTHPDKVAYNQEMLGDPKPAKKKK